MVVATRLQISHQSVDSLFTVDLCVERRRWRIVVEGDAIPICEFSHRALGRRRLCGHIYLLQRGTGAGSFLRHGDVGPRHARIFGSVEHPTDGLPRRVRSPVVQTRATDTKVSKHTLQHFLFLLRHLGAAHLLLYLVHRERGALAGQVFQNAESGGLLGQDVPQGAGLLSTHAKHHRPALTAAHTRAEVSRPRHSLHSTRRHIQPTKTLLKRKYLRTLLRRRPGPHLRQPTTRLSRIT